MSTTLGLVLAVLVQTAVVSYWGGRIAKSVEHHGTEIEGLRRRWHDGLAGLLLRGVAALEELVEWIKERRRGQPTG